MAMITRWDVEYMGTIGDHIIGIGDQTANKSIQILMMAMIGLDTNISN